MTQQQRTAAAAPARPEAARLAAFCDGPVWFAILLLLVVLFAWPWTHRHLAALGYPPETFFWRYLAVALIGAAVGGAELVSRYRDEPWLVLRSSPGAWFILVNAGASLIALVLLEHYRGQLTAAVPPAPGSLDDGITRVLLAGFGAMVLLRAKLLTVRQPGGGEVQVGPAFVLDTMLAAVNREADRRRAELRMKLVGDLARRFVSYPFETAAPHFTAALLALQTMDTDESRRLSERIRTLTTDETLKTLPPIVQYTMLGYDFLTAFGDVACTTVFERVLETLSQPGAGTAGNPAP